MQGGGGGGGGGGIMSFSWNLLGISQNTFRYCRVRFYALFGQPLSKQLYVTTL